MLRCFSFGPALAGLMFFIATARAQVSQPVYNEALVNGWQSYGWATLNYSSTNVVHGGSNDISVTAAQWEALSLHHSAFDTSIYSNLVFWINGGAGGQKLLVQALLNGVAQPAVNLPTLATNTWQQITLSLASLGVSNKANMDGFWIQDRSGVASPVFYVDDVQLTAIAVPATVHLAVNAAQTVRTVDARWFGVNTAVWDSNFDTTNTLALLQQCGDQVLRYPGGSTSDDYHWASNTSGSSSAGSTSFSKFAHIATNLGAQVFITVNYGSGTPAEAAAWVRNSNITNHYGFRYWEIGNENYGDWENDVNTVAHDPYTYALRATNFIALMRAADPTIKIGLVAVVGEDGYANNTSHPATNPRTGVVHNGWDPVMLTTLRNAGVTPDFLIYHRYAQEPGQENDQYLLQSSKTWKDDAANLRQQLTDYLGASATNVELICTENNSVSGGPGKQTTSLVNALFQADSFGQLAQTEFNSLVWWDLRNDQETWNNNDPALYGWRQYGDYGILSTTNERYPSYFSAKLLQNFARAGDTIIPVTSDYLFLSAYAARRTNGMLSLLVVNKSPSNTFSGNIAVAGYQAGTNAAVFSYGIPQDEAARTGIGSPDITQTNLTTAGTNFTFAFAPYSLSVFNLTPAPPKLLVPLNAGASNQFHFQLQGQSGVRYIVQASSNLVNWSAFSTNAFTNNAAIDLVVTNQTRFYRAVWLPN